MEDKSHLAYGGVIKSIKFQINGDEDIKAQSVIAVKKADLWQNNKPQEYGIYDAHMGTTDHSYECQTCHQSKKHCPGHSGHIVLNYPVLSPMALTEIRKWVKVTCFKCGRSVIPLEVMNRFPRSKRLTECAKLAKSSAVTCSCGTRHPSVSKNKREALLLTAELRSADGKTISNSWTLYPHNIADILGRITNRMVIDYGRPLESHPRKFVLHNVLVPANTIRPDVKKVGGGRSNNDDITTILQYIIRHNSELPTVLPETINADLEAAIVRLNNTYHEMIKGSSKPGKIGSVQHKSLAQRLRGKQGRFRQNQLGKRTRNNMRSTITGNPRIRLDSVIIPKKFAKIIQIPEVVQDYNRAKLTTYVMNGRDKYPGCSKVYRVATGTEHAIESLKNTELQNGDVVHRDIITGDVFYFNRQPTLTLSSITAVKAVVSQDDVKTLSFNVILCPLFNADFDGDAMNGYVLRNRHEIHEITEMGGLDQWLISHATAAPSIGQVDDSIVGNFELTRSSVRMNKYHTMMLFQHTGYLPTFDKLEYTGREAVSLILQNTPITYTSGVEYYNEAMAPYIAYDPTETQVQITAGSLTSGVLDKKTIGKGARGGIYHVVANEYSASRAADCIFDMQQLAIQYVEQNGFTIGIMDITLPETTRNEINEIASDIMNQSDIVTQKLLAGEIIPPLGLTTEQFYEQNQISILQHFEDFMGPILKAINPETNNLFKLIACGSKGKMESLYNISSAIGQKLINGERIRQKYGHKRSLIYYKRFETNPLSRGYIANSYINGMTVTEYIFNAMNARFDLISKALSTSITGDQNRKSIKNLESIVTNNFRWCKKAQNVIQCAYGGDYLDPRRIENVKIPTIMISDAEFAKWRYDGADPVFEREFEALRDDRETYRKLFIRIERTTIKDMMSDSRLLPVNVSRIVVDVLTTSGATDAPDAKTLAKMVTRIASYCEDLPYVFLNAEAQRKKRPIPQIYHCAARTMIMQIRSYLAAVRIAAGVKIAGKSKYIDEAALERILNKIWVRYSNALVDPGTAIGIISAQSFSEPLTQYMLDAHHRSATGGTSKSSMIKVKEVLGAKSVDKLSGASMLIVLKPEIATDKSKVQMLANSIEVIKLRQLTVAVQIFFEKFGEPVHPLYVHEREIIAEFMKNNPALKPPADLIKWCIRIQFDKSSLILKNLSIETVVTQLRDLYPESYIVYTSENANIVLIRMYLRTYMFKNIVTLQHIIDKKDEILEANIRGVEGILSTNVIELIRNVAAEDGSYKRGKGIYGIQTNGTNMQAIMQYVDVDCTQLQTDAIQEIYSMLGIEAARQKIILELQNLADKCNYRHYSIYADEMTYTGVVTSIEKSGLSHREPSNKLLRIGFSSPIQVIEEAGINGSEDIISGITAPLLVGSIPKIGTLYNRVYIDEDYIKANIKSVGAKIDEL